MKKIRIFALASFLLTVSVAAAAPYGFSHGPYLQELTPTGVTFVFTTSDKGFSWVELRSPEGEITRHYAVKDGLRDAYNTFCTIRTDSLRPATAYDYRLCSKRIDDFQPYRVTFGDSIVSRWYAFRTPDPRSEECSFVALSDMHGDSAKLARLLALAGVESADRIFYVGDMMNYFVRPEQPYESFIDVSVDRFAKHKPFAVVRGNHETRGALARTYDRYIHNNPEGRYYGFYTFGDTAVVMLDCGEDKPDSHDVYAGFAAFDEYREQQAAWLREVVKSKEFRRARHRIVMIHIPPVDERMAEQDPATVKEMLEWRGNEHWGRLLLPVLNGAKIDALFSAHQHSFHLLPALKGVHDFPIVVNDNKSAMLIRCDAEGVRVRITDIDGREIMDRTL